MGVQQPVDDYYAERIARALEEAVALLRTWRKE